MCPIPKSVYNILPLHLQRLSQSFRYFDSLSGLSSQTNKWNLMPSPWSCTRRPAANTNLSLLLSSLPLFAFSLTPSLLQGRPIREQQELAAAVIQRCYKKYKQVSAQYRRYYPVYHLSLVSVTIMSGILSSPSFFFHKLTWIALKVIWSFITGHTRVRSVRSDVHALVCSLGSMHFIRR